MHNPEETANEFASCVVDFFGNDVFNLLGFLDHGHVSNKQREQIINHRVWIWLL